MPVHNHEQTGPPVPVLIEPKAGHLLQEVLSVLDRVNAQHIQPVGQTFISADIDLHDLPDLEAIAHVEVKAEHSLFEL